MTLPNPPTNGACADINDSLLDLFKLEELTEEEDQKKLKAKRVLLEEFDWTKEDISEV